MIMRPGQQLLLPANPVFIWFSLFVALVFNMLMNMGLFGRAAWVPDLLAVVLVFWSVHQPLRIGVGVAFAFGLAMDVHQGALLGQHALAYTALGFLGISMHRRLLWFTVPNQAVQVLPLFVAAHVLELLVRMVAGGSFPGIAYLLAPLIEAALWPVVSVLLLLPQRRAPNPDDNRPL
ncbi:rod shape-determining protein MreD [Hydrogenophaga sp. BPS33]|uniref:rod shape-determining protein MreD n=1 Tax=Hydrogenophaga sp. BPS33 TaxID=2651974 RepID=UPI00131F5004|nr:rod shape-determining protein MreD [Hydrogenophaga sp. BPS33]QHE83721.1 rod shape-determining protein MreD [Hydrogenophaga sp. BPS33]